MWEQWICNLYNLLPHFAFKLISISIISLKCPLFFCFSQCFFFLVLVQHWHFKENMSSPTSATFLVNAEFFQEVLKMFNVVWGGHKEIHSLHSQDQDKVEVLRPNTENYWGVKNKHWKIPQMSGVQVEKCRLLRKKESMWAKECIVQWSDSTHLDEYFHCCREHRVQYFTALDVGLGRIQGAFCTPIFIQCNHSLH